MREPEATERMLLESTKSWQWQIDRARGLTAHAGLLATMGRFDEARRLREALARLNERWG